MKFTILLSLALSQALAYPGMDTTIEEISKRADEFDSTELIGDLLTLTDAQLTPVGQDIKSVILGGNGQSTAAWSSAVPKQNTPECKKDTCCIWQYISNDMKAAFTGSMRRCNGLARGAVRLGFHDAAGWSKNTGNLGGADGSIILAPAEMQRGENNGLQEIVAQMQIWYNKYNPYGVTMADLIQMGATVATVVCPLGPRIKSYVGRKDSSVAATDGLLPGVNQNADALIQLFKDKTIAPHGLVALIGAHTTSQQRFVDPSRRLDPQDSTPGVWDVLFYKQTLGNAPRRVFKFASDLVLSKDSRTTQEFQEFAGQNGQDHWNEDYAREYVRLSMLGVFNINNLTDCSKVLPQRISSFVAPDQSLIDQWLSTKGTVGDVVAEALRAGNSVLDLAGYILGLLTSLLGGRGPR